MAGEGVVGEHSHTGTKNAAAIETRIAGEDIAGERCAHTAVNPTVSTVTRIAGEGVAGERHGHTRHVGITAIDAAASARIADKGVACEHNGLATASSAAAITA